MKILSLVWFNIYPALFGGQKGIAEFNEHLSQYYPVDCLCAADNEVVTGSKVTIIPELPISKWQFFHPFVWRKIRQKCKKERYSHIIIEFPYYGFLGSLLKRKGTFYILHAHNIEGERFKSLGKLWWRPFRYYEKWCMQKADLVLFKTENDKADAIRHYSLKEEQTHVVPYGIAPKSVINKKEGRQFLESLYNIKPEEKILLFAGTLDYLPNAEVCSIIYHHIAPLLEQLSPYPFKIIICGRNKLKVFSYLKAYQHKQIIQAGFVEKIEPYFAGADVFINPVKKVYGVQTKIMDALMYHLNVVTFEEATAGLPSYLLNKKVFTANSNYYEDFARQTIQALNATSETPNAFFETFHWKNIVQKFVKKLNTISPNI